MTTAFSKKTDKYTVEWEAHSAEGWGEPALGSATAAGGFWKSLGSTRLPDASGSSTWAPKAMLHLPPGMLFFSVSLCWALFLVSPGTDAPSFVKGILMDCPLTPCSLWAPLSGLMRPCLSSSLSSLLESTVWVLCHLASTVPCGKWDINKHVKNEQRLNEKLVFPICDWAGRRFHFFFGRENQDRVWPRPGGIS